MTVMIIRPLSQTSTHAFLFKLYYTLITIAIAIGIVIPLFPVIASS